MKSIIKGFLLGVLVVFLLGNSVENGLVVDTAKLDNQPCDGLTGTYDSLCYRVNEIEAHVHNNERFFGLHGTPSGEVTRMQSIDTTSTPFQVDAGNDTWGTWLQVVGSGDTPVQAGMAYFDFHEIEFVAREHNTTVYKMQIACGDSGADALAAGTYSETIRFSGGAQTEGGPEIVQMHRYPSGTKCWIRIWAIGQNTSTMDFFIGLHEYEG